MRLYAAPGRVRKTIQVMAARASVGDAVQTPFGKGVIREVRNNGRLLVEIQQRTLVVAESSVTPLHKPQQKARSTPDAVGSRPIPRRDVPHAAREVDLHGLTVEEALVRVDEVLDAAMLAGHAELRFIHGRSGGRIRGALHQRLRAISTVQGFRLDPANAGVTIVSL
jgi:DNA mismatch repair protein MutS2